MPAKRSYAIQTLLVTVVLNGALLAAIALLLGDALAASNQTMLLFAIAGVVTLALWLINYWIGGRIIDRDRAPVAASPPARQAAAPPPAAPAAAPIAAAPPMTRPQPVAVSAESGAVQLLAILQRKGRLIDFLCEDLRAYDDAQIGAAVRPIHEGCRQALDEHVKLEPIFAEAEGSPVSVQPGFDPRAVRLSGTVAGEPPFRGELRHRGWRVVNIELPKTPNSRDEQRIVAAAEVELLA